MHNTKVLMRPLGALRAVGLPRQRGIERIAVHGLAAGFALHESDRLAAGHVDGGQQREGHEPHANERCRNGAASATMPAAR